MHELSVVKALLDSVAQYQNEAKRDKVKGIRIEVGDLTCVDSERLKFCFDMVREEAGMDGAELTIEHVRATAQCKSCGNEYELNNVGEACPCGSFEHDMMSGNELNLTEIEFI